MGFKTILFEKESYPFHKVCGEYISMESYDFLQHLGVPLEEMHLPKISQLQLTAPNGKIFETTLPLGGFGISRYTLDHRLAQLARATGVVVMENTKVESISFQHEKFQVQSGSGQYSAKICLAAYGKRSNLDVKWNRGFLKAYDRRLENFVAVKYHITTSWPEETIGLHNFENGYCGISKIDAGLYCLCYLTRASELKKYGQVKMLEEKNLWKNPHLEKIFSQSVIEKDFPITISQVSFNKKTRVENHVLMLGDAAGMIAPLCGNGMSIALHTGKIAALEAGKFLSGKISREKMESAFETEWKKYFSGRLRTGRILQRFFGRPGLSNLFVQTFRSFPFLAGPLVKMTHGKRF